MSEPFCAEALAAYAEACLREKTFYLWGGMGQRMTRDYLLDTLCRFPGHFRAESFMELYDRADGSMRVFDCGGLIKRFLMGGLEHYRYDAALDCDALELYRASEVSGRMFSLPEVPGLCLYLQDHVGIYMGGGEVIEATVNPKFGSGVVKTKLRDRNWENWFCCKGVTYPAVVLQYASPKEKSIYLTFDDGPSDITEAILRLLKEADAKACFFVKQTHRPELLRRICEEGHQLGLHTYSHTYSEIYASPEAYFADLEKLETYIWETVGLRPRLVRLPGGTNNMSHRCYCQGIMPVIVRELDRRGYRIFDWNSSFRDDEFPELSPEEYLKIGRHYLRGRNISFFLIHDFAQNKRLLPALNGLLDTCREQHIAFRTPDQYEEKHYLFDRNIL